VDITTRPSKEIFLVSDLNEICSTTFLIGFPFFHPKEKIQQKKQIDLRSCLEGGEPESNDKPNLKRLEARRQNQQSISNTIKIALGLQPRPRKSSSGKIEELKSGSSSEAEAEKGRNVNAKEFLPKRKQIKPQVSSMSLSNIYQIPTSKVQSRLERIKNSAASNINSNVFGENQEMLKIFDMKSVKLQNDSHTLLPEDQQLSLLHISNLESPRYFQEAFDYFVSYYEEEQKVILNYDAIESFLGLKGITVKRKVEDHQVFYKKSDFPDLKQMC
jgi:hypothetical protein